MQIQINIPRPDQEPARRRAPARRFYFQSRDQGLQSHLSAVPAEFGISNEVGFRVPDFRVRWTRPLIGMVLAAALLPISHSSAQSLWRDDSSRPMFSDKRATAIGDILTIVVQETTTASKDNSTTTSKSSDQNASITSFLYSPGASKLLTQGGQFPALQYSSKNDFAGGGKIGNSENIVAQVAVQVVDVLPNRNLVIEGKRETAFSGERQTVVLRGIVRPDDVAANNTVFSYNVADATIHIISKGTITDNQRKGWFNRIWDKLSPF